MKKAISISEQCRQVNAEVACLRRSYRERDGRIRDLEGRLMIARLAAAGSSLRTLRAAHRRLREIARIIERVDNRCAAVDGPVTPTLHEMTPQEMRRIYRLANGRR